jgi:hypothetical protein
LGDHDQAGAPAARVHRRGGSRGAPALSRKRSLGRRAGVRSAGRSSGRDGHAGAGQRT